MSPTAPAKPEDSYTVQLLCGQKKLTRTHLPVNTEMTFSGFLVLRELHLAIPHTISYRILRALIEPTMLTLYKTILFFTNKF